MPRHVPVWLDSLQGRGQPLDIGHTARAKVCSRHFDPRDISAKLTVSKTAVPWVDPAKVADVAAEPSARCSVVCCGSGAFGLQAAAGGVGAQVVIQLAWNVGNTVLARQLTLCAAVL